MNLRPKRRKQRSVVRKTDFRTPIACETAKLKGEVVPMLNKVPIHEEVSRS